MLLILRTTCCDMHGPLGRGIIQPRCLHTATTGKKNKIRLQCISQNARTSVIHIHMHNRPPWMPAHLRLLPTRLLPVKGFSAPLPLEVGKVMEFLGLRECWFLVFWSRWLVCAFFVETFASTSMLVSI